MSSLLEALHVSPARVRRRKSPHNKLLYSPKMSCGIRVEVILLDGRRLEVGVGPRLVTQELVAMVASHFTLRESHYFSLALLDSTGHYQWLSPDRRLVDHEGARHFHGRPLTLYFLVKFYIESVTDLRDVQTIELFYQQAKSLVAKDDLEVLSKTSFKLAALAIQASQGDYIDENFTKSQLKKHNYLPQSVFREHPSLQFCEESVCQEHQHLRGLSRGDAILQYMSIVEKLPTYGIHYYEVKDRSGLPWYLGLSHRGIAQYDYLDKRKPRRVFLWKHLENLYFRERKFSIEVHDPKRVSVSRRTFGPSNVSVYVWVAETQALCKAIWSMAIAQHQFYLDRKTLKCDDTTLRDLPDLAVDLSHSCLSLSTHSSSSNLSRSGSHSSLQNHSHTDSGSTESFHLARMEMHSALQQRQEALKEKLKEKTEELRLLCLREGELTGSLPPEYPHVPGQPPPVVRKRVGTSFTLDENLINKIINKQEETVASIELEYEIQDKITTAALRLANESSAKKSVRKQRKMSYQLAVSRLKQLEQKLKAARAKQAAVVSSMPKQKKKPRPISDVEGMNSVDESTYSLSQESPRDPLGLEGVSLSPNVQHPPMSPRSSLPHTIRSRRRDISPTKPVPNAAHSPHSAPPSPHKNGNPNLSVNSTATLPSTPSTVNDSRSDSPGRPPSGYIPSSVYTRSQYRSQHYQTLATRCQSVPGDESRDSLSDLQCNHHLRSSSAGGRPALDNSIGENGGGLYNIPQQRTSLASHSLDDLDSPTSPNGTPCSTNVTNQSYTNGHHRRQRYESHDRYGSLDRRRATNGWLESRSMEHLDSLPVNTPPQPAHPPHVYNNNNSKVHSPYSPYHGPNPVHKLHPEMMELTNGDSHLTTANSSFDTSTTAETININDVVDGKVLRTNLLRHRCHSGSGTPQSNYHHIQQSSQQQTYIQTINNNWEKMTHKLVRTPSGRSYMETTFLGEQTNNQENIPPLRPTSELLPLRATTKERTDHINHVPLRPTASVNTADVLPPRVPINDLIPLRATKSSSELPPLKATTARSDPSSIVNTTITEEPLISLAEAARSKKDRREWYETSLDSPSSARKNRMLAEVSKCSPNSIIAPSNHSVSTSSIGSTGSGSGSSGVFQSTNEGSDSLNTSMSIDSPRNHMMITAGTYQPSREVSKPFEMSDFYKYSVKFRKQSSSSSLNNGHSSGTDSPMSPILPPRAQMLMSSSKLRPPSPGMVAQQSTPAPQQKGVYQPLTPLTCKPLEVIANVAVGEPEDPVGGAWESTPLHQAVPATVTNKRAATLV